MPKNSIMSTRQIIYALCLTAIMLPRTVLSNDTERLDPYSVKSVNTASEKPITLDIFFVHHKRGEVYDNDWPVEKHAGNVTNVSLNNVTPKDGTIDIAAFNLLLANGEMPDIVGGKGLRTQFNTHGPKGMFVPLNDLIEEHAPHIHQYFQENPEIIQAVSAGDGNLYHIPYIPDGKFGRAYYIRTDWLKQLGLEIPDTVEDLYHVLKAFKNDDPNGNGIADEIPYFVRSRFELVRLVTLWDARSTGTDTAHDFYVKNGKIRHGYLEENYRVGIRNIAKWYSEGLIDADVYDRRGDVRKELLGSNVGGMTHDWFASTASYNDRLADTIEGFEFSPIAPPKTPSGKRIEEHRRIAIKPGGWAITSNNQSPIETIKYFDFWFSPYGKRLANFGIEGSEYTVIDGMPVFTDEVLNGDIPVNRRLWSVGAQVYRGFIQDYEYERQWTNKIALAGIDMYEKGNFLVEPFHGVTMNERELEIFDDYWSEILAFMIERQEEWILGYRDVDRDWDSYIKRIEKLGIDKVLAVMQSAYNRQYSLNQANLLD